MKRLPLLVALTRCALIAFSAAVTQAAPDAAKLYAAKCASCHGENGDGNPAKMKTLKVEQAALDLLDPESLAKNEDEWFKLTKDGVKKMPKFVGKLTDEEIHAINGYVRGLAESAAAAR
jgi:mono/diheme cytochrome c family protein